MALLRTQLRKLGLDVHGDVSACELEADSTAKSLLPELLEINVPKLPPGLCPKGKEKERGRS